MKTDQKRLGWTTKAFFPDVTDIKNHEESKAEAFERHFSRAKPLLEGALGILTAAGDNQCEHCTPAQELIEAFLEAMEMGEDAFDAANIHNQPPFVTLDELRKMLGDLGQADVTIRMDNEGYHNYKMVQIGRDYRTETKKTNGKKPKKAA